MATAQRPQSQPGGHGHWGRSPERADCGRAPPGPGDRGGGLEPGRPSAVGALGPTAGAGGGRSGGDGGGCWSACGHRQGSALPCRPRGPCRGSEQGRGRVCVWGPPASAPTRRGGGCRPPRHSEKLPDGAWATLPNPSQRRRRVRRFPRPSPASLPDSRSWVPRGPRRGREAQASLTRPPHLVHKPTRDTEGVSGTRPGVSAETPRRGAPHVTPRTAGNPLPGRAPPRPLPAPRRIPSPASSWAPRPQLPWRVARITTVLRTRVPGPRVASASTPARDSPRTRLRSRGPSANGLRLARKRSPIADPPGPGCRRSPSRVFALIDGSQNTPNARLA